MRKLILLSGLLFATHSFANEIKITNVKGDVLPHTICQTSQAKDSEGNVVASATCCQTFPSQPDKPTTIATMVALKFCSDTALEKILYHMAQG